MYVKKLRLGRNLFFFYRAGPVLGCTVSCPSTHLVAGGIGGGGGRGAVATYFVVCFIPQTDVGGPNSTSAVILIALARPR